MKLLARNFQTDDKEISFLAVLETIAASGLAFWIAFGLGKGQWLAVYCLIAPLLLLRTKASSLLGLSLFQTAVSYQVTQKVADRWTKSFGLGGIIGYILLILLWGVLIYVPLFVVIAILIKISATAVCFWRNPLSTIQTIPKNWYSTVFRTDSSLVPELIPGIEEVYPQDVTGLQLSWYWSLIFDPISSDDFETPPQKTPTFIKLLVAALVFVPVSIIYLCGVTYRWALKASAIVYLPLIVLVQATVRSGESLRHVCSRILDLHLSRVLRIWGIAVLVTNGVLPIAAVSVLNSLGTWLSETAPAAKPFYEYLLPIGEIKMWHVAGLISASITWSMFFWADSIRKNWKHTHPSGSVQRRILKNFRLLFSIRAFCTAYSIVCAVVAVAKTQNWVQFRLRWLP